MNLGRRVWIGWLRVEYRALAIGLPMIIAMLWAVLFLVLSLPYLAWIGVAPAAWLGWKAWPLASEIA